MLFGLPIPVLLMILFGVVALIGFLLCLFSNSNSDWNALGLGLLFGAAIGFLGIGLCY